MRYRQSSRALARTVGDSIILTLPGHEAFEQLTATSAMTWCVLDAPHTLADLIERLAGLYDMHAQTITSDVEHLLNDLISRGLIEEIEEIGV